MCNQLKKQYYPTPELEVALNNLNPILYGKVNRAILVLVRRIRDGEVSPAQAISKFGIVVVTRNEKGDFIAGFQGEV